MVKKLEDKINLEKAKSKKLTSEVQSLTEQLGLKQEIIETQEAKIKSLEESLKVKSEEFEAHMVSTDAKIKELQQMLQQSN